MNKKKVVNSLSIIGKLPTLSIPGAGAQLLAQEGISLAASEINEIAEAIPKVAVILKEQSDMVISNVKEIIEEYDPAAQIYGDWKHDQVLVATILVHNWVQKYPGQYGQGDQDSIRNGLVNYLRAVEQWALTNVAFLEHFFVSLDNRVRELERKPENQDDQQKKTVRTVKSDNDSYRKSYHSPLFLEAAENKVRLEDVYVRPRVNSWSYLQKSETDLELMSFVQDYCKNSVEQKVLYLYGKPGSGKSAWVSFLSEELKSICNDRKYYLIRLRNMTNAQINQTSPIDGLLDYMNALADDLKNAVLVLDGLDEICALYHNSNMHLYLAKLTQALSEIDGLQTIITTRPGYISLDKKMQKAFLIMELQNWKESDFQYWADRYVQIHPEIQDIIEKNTAHLVEDASRDQKKTMFSVPILFYMANAKGLLIENYSSVCELYDAVFSNVLEEHSYDPSVHRNMDEIIHPDLARQICREIAFSMFRNGRLYFTSQDDPYLAPDEVSDAIEQAFSLTEGSAQELSQEDKERIKKIYTLTFFYNTSNQGANAVEFAHKSIAEYFIAEKIAEMLAHMNLKHPNMETIAEAFRNCFGYNYITTEICLFLNEKIRQQEKELASLKKYLEASFLQLVYSELLWRPVADREMMSYLDRPSIILRSVLLLMEYLDCKTEDITGSEAEKDYFNSMVGNIARIKLSDKKFGIGIPLSLNGFRMIHGQFQNGDFAEAHLSGTYLESADFEEAKLADASFYQASLTATGFMDAELIGADISDLADSSGADFTGANMSCCTIENNTFINCSFENADLSNATIYGCTFDEECNLYNTNFYDANVSQCDISKVDISDIVFEDLEAEEAFGEVKIVWSKITLTQEQMDDLSGKGVVVEDAILVE